MKLIDLLVKELPKRGGWPGVATHAWSDSDGEIRFRNGGCRPDFYPAERVDSGDRIPSIMHEDDPRYIVTRAQYEAALAKNDGWIDWGGGECPVPQGTLVDVRYRCGKENHHVKAGIFGDDSGSDPEHHAGYWGGYSQWDIIAYRLHRDINSRANDDRLEQDLKEIEVPGKYLDDIMNIPVRIDRLERDLNECIGQAGEPKAWFPAVGEICQARIGGEWTDVKVAYIGDEGSWNEALVFDVKSTRPAWADEFQPMRTDAEKAREEAIEFIREIIDAKAGDPFNSARFIYECMMGGNIPGVKMEVK